MLQYKEYNDSLINHLSGWPQTLKRKQNEITSSPIIYLADHELYNINRKHWQSHGSSTSHCPRTLQHKQKQWQTRLVGNYLTNLLQNLHSMKKQSCDQISNLTLMNIIKKRYYQFLDMQTLQHKQEKIIIQWINRRLIPNVINNL